MTTYKIDPAHSEITFKVKHLMITNVTGKFTKFDATMQADRDDFTDAVVIFEADVNSITTHTEQRDAHLKSDDFFNAEKYPKITFKSTALKKESDEDYKLFGDLTIRDITKPIELKVTYNGLITDPWGNERAGFEIEGKINRLEYGLKWNVLTDTGGMVAGKDVKLLINVEMVKQTVEAAQQA
ncbi:MAG TPA: YceI family protein [Chitinophagaceae bacterium]|nr:YceI family protein [Chitinophagaceae bacterium]